VAGDDQLSAAVLVGDRHRAALAAGRGAAGLEVVGGHVDDRRHRADARRHRGLHRLAAQAHELDRVGERERPGGDQRRELAEAVAETHHRGEPSSSRRTVHAAMLQVRIAGWVLAVRASCSSGP
jgi:hypothetical protein